MRRSVVQLRRECAVQVFSKRKTLAQGGIHSRRASAIKRGPRRQGRRGDDALAALDDVVAEKAQ